MKIDWELIGKGVSPSEVSCYKCKAKAGEICRQPNGLPSKQGKWHMARKHEAQVERYNRLVLMNAGMDGQDRQDLLEAIGAKPFSLEADKEANP